MLDTRAHNTSFGSPQLVLSNELLHDCVCWISASLCGARNRKFTKVGHLWPRLFPKQGQNRKKCSNQLFENSSKMLNPRDCKVLAKIVVTGCHASWYPPKHVLCPQPQTVCANWAYFIPERGLSKCSTCIKFGCDPTRFRYSWTVPKVLAPTRMAPWPFKCREVWGQFRIELV